MSKKSFKSGIDSLLQSTTKNDDIELSEVIGKNKSIEIRSTFLVDKNLLNSIKSIAYWDRLAIKDVVNDAFKNHIGNYIKKNGKIESIPKK